MTNLISNVQKLHFKISSKMTISSIGTILAGVEARTLLLTTVKNTGDIENSNHRSSQAQCLYHKIIANTFE